MAAPGLPLYRRIEARPARPDPRRRPAAGRPGLARAGADGGVRRQPGDGPPGARRPRRGGPARDPARPRDVRDRAAVRAHDRRVLLVQPGDRAARPAAGDEGPRPPDAAGRRRRRRAARDRARAPRSSRCGASASPARTRWSSRPATFRRPGSRAWRTSTSRAVRLYDTLLNAYGCRPTRARETFEPILLTADEAALLDQRRGEPALRVERVAFDQDDAPIEFCRSTVRGDRYRYSVELRDR